MKFKKVEHSKSNMFHCSKMTEITDIDELLISAIESDNIELIKELIKKSDINFGLEYASENGYYNAVKLFVENGADTSTNVYYPIRKAAANNHYEIVEYLIQFDVQYHIIHNCVKHAIHTHSNYEMAAILLKCQKYCSPVILNYWIESENNYKIVELFIKNGVDLNPCDDEFNPLNYAIRTHNKEIIKLLVINGSNVNFKCANLLKYAIEQNDKELIHFAIDNGADYTNPLVDINKLLELLKYDYPFELIKNYHEKTFCTDISNLIK